MARVSGCSGPRTRSSTGSSAANWSRAAAGSPASPVQRARSCAGGQGVRVLRAEDPLVHGQQRGELVAGGGRVPRLPGPVGEVVPGGQGVRVLRAEDPFPCVKHSPLEIPGGGVTAARSEVSGDPGHPVAVIGESRLGVRQQRRAYRPGLGRVGIVGDRGLDQRGSGLAPLTGQVGRHLVSSDGLHQPVHRAPTRPRPG